MNNSTKRRLFVFTFALFIAQSVYSQVGIDSVAARIREQVYQYPQEKIYVATDRNNYVAGDTIWMRAFVVNAADNREVDVSRYVYAELVSPFNISEARVKVVKRNGHYFGYIPLPRKNGRR